jgi:hypothetical protein
VIVLAPAVRSVQSALVALWQFFASTKKYSESPEVVARPVGTTVLYVLLSLSIVGCIIGLFPAGESCKQSDPPVCASAHHNYVLAIVSASVAVLIVALLVWSRWQDNREGRSA